jgi:hypothetical protein
LELLKLDVDSAWIRVIIEDNGKGIRLFDFELLKQALNGLDAIEQSKLQRG